MCVALEDGCAAYSMRFLFFLLELESVKSM